MIDSKNVFTWARKLLDEFKNEHPNLDNSRLILGLKQYAWDAMRENIYQRKKAIDPLTDINDIEEFSYFDIPITKLPDNDATSIRWLIK